MADEAVIIELLGNQGNVVDFTVADGVSISKGTILRLTDPRTASASTAAGEAFAGIAASDKIANDGSTNLGAYTYGIFDLKVSGASVVAGEAVIISGANLIAEAAAANLLTGDTVGKALETAAGGTAETIEVLVGVR